MKPFQIKNIDDPEYTRDYEILEKEKSMMFGLFLKYHFLLPLIATTPKDATILDIGCAHGFFLKYLLCKGFTKLYGMDLKNQLYKDVASSKSVTFFKRSILDPQVSDIGKFDAINISGVLHHLPPEKITAVIPIVSKMLKPSGTLYIYEPNKFSALGKVFYKCLLPVISPLLYRLTEYENDIQRAFCRQMPIFIQQMQSQLRIVSYSSRLFYFSIVAKKNHN